MKIAIPTSEDGKLSAHFGHCEKFSFFELDSDAKSIVNLESKIPPPHEPGILPKWLAENNVDLIIAGGMGQRAQMLFAQNNIEVLVGVPSDPTEEIIRNYVEGKLSTGENLCDH